MIGIFEKENEIKSLLVCVSIFARHCMLVVVLVVVRKKKVRNKGEGGYFYISWLSNNFMLCKEEETKQGVWEEGLLKKAELLACCHDTNILLVLFFNPPFSSYFFFRSPFRYLMQKMRWNAGLEERKAFHFLVPFPPLFTRVERFASPPLSSLILYTEKRKWWCVFRRTCVCVCVYTTLLLHVWPRFSRERLGACWTGWREIGWLEPIRDFERWMEARGIDFSFPRPLPICSGIQ